MVNEELIDPVIWRGNGECPACGGSMHVVDQEVSVMKVNKDGMPTTEDTSIKVTFICARCGSKFPAVRDGMGYRLYTEASHLIRMAEITRQREQELLAKRNEPINNVFGFGEQFEQFRALFDIFDDDDNEDIRDELCKHIKSATITNKNGKTVKWKNGVKIE